MAKKDAPNLAMSLFASYRDYGKNPDVFAYCDFLFGQVDSTFIAKQDFNDVARALKAHFERRLTQYTGHNISDGFRIINGAFWNEIARHTDNDHLYTYYIRTDSSPQKLREVVANDFYIINERLGKQFGQILKQAVYDKTALLKILSRGGEGKSTFLYHITRQYFDQFNIVLLEKLDTEVLVRIEEKLRLMDTRLPLLLIMDNPAVHSSMLTQFMPKVTEVFRKYNLIFVVAEREFRYKNIEEVHAFEDHFDEVYGLEYKAGYLREQIFDKFISLIPDSETLSAKDTEDAKEVYLKDYRRSISENTFAVLRFLRERDKIKFAFDWEDWAKFSKREAPNLEHLYLLLATFYQFGFSLEVNFCASLLDRASPLDINSALGRSRNLPIYIAGNHLFLRHETLASWFFDYSDEAGIKNKEGSIYIFQEFLDNIDSPFAKDLFIWISGHKEFQRSHLATCLDHHKRIQVLTSYIAKNPSELKCRTELAKIYQATKKLEIAEKVLLQLKEIDPDNLHARTELSKIYQRQKKWRESTQLLQEYIELDPEGLHPRTELSKIYQRREKWKEAEAILLECLEIDPEDIDSRTELAKVYKHDQRWLDAENILLECVALDSNDVHSRLELGKLCSRIEDRWTEALDYFDEIILIQPENLYAKTELAYLYAKMHRYPEREKILFEIYQDHPDDLPTLMGLAVIFKRFKKYRIALTLLGSALEVRQKNLLTISRLIELHNLFGDEKNANIFKEMGDKIISRDRHSQHRDRFLSVHLPPFYERELLELWNVGFWVESNKGTLVGTQEGLFPLVENAIVNYNVKNMHRVYFATYLNN